MQVVCYEILNVHRIYEIHNDEHEGKKTFFSSQLLGRLLWKMYYNKLLDLGSVWNSLIQLQLLVLICTKDLWK